MNQIAVLPFAILVPITAVSAIVFTVLREVKGGIFSLVSKTFASLMFLITGIVLTSVLKSWVLGYVISIVAGMFFSVIGDVFLDLKRWDTKYTDVFFNSGVLSFAIAHVMYLTFMCFYTIDVVGGSILIPCLVGLVAIPIGVIVVLVAKKLGLNLGKHTLKSILYICLLIYMAVTASTNAGINGTSSNYLWMHAVAICMFLSADLILSITYFGNKENKVLMRTCSIVNHLLYYAAQLMMCSIIVFVS